MTLSQQLPILRANNQQIRLFFTLQDSYALCRVFKKNIVIPNKTSSKEPIGTAFDQVLWDEDNGATPESSRDQRENADDDDVIKNHQLRSKNPSEASSSDLTQGTPIAVASKDGSTAQIASDEVNSSNDPFYFYGTENLSNYIQVINLICVIS